jgi:hypothetical protein
MRPWWLFWIGTPAIDSRSVVLKKLVLRGHHVIVYAICAASNWM